MQDRGIHVRDEMAILDRVKAKFIGGTMHDPATDSTPGHADRKAVIVMIAAVGSLYTGGPAKLGGEDDDCFIQ